MAGITNKTGVLYLLKCNRWNERSEFNEWNSEKLVALSFFQINLVLDEPRQLLHPANEIVLFCLLCVRLMFIFLIIHGLLECFSTFFKFRGASRTFIRQDRNVLISRMFFYSIECKLPRHTYGCVFLIALRFGSIIKLMSGTNKSASKLQFDVENANTNEM